MILKIAIFDIFDEIEIDWAQVWVVMQLKNA